MVLYLVLSKAKRDASASPEDIRYRLSIPYLGFRQTSGVDVVHPAVRPSVKTYFT